MGPARDDPLMLYGRRPCLDCECQRRKRKRCERCKGAGFERADLANLWAPRPGFLVGGGPSLKNIDTDLLRQRGVVSLGINNVAGAVPVRAQVFGDPQGKFHHGLFFDPAMMTFCPIGKMPFGVRAKLPEPHQQRFADGNFRPTDARCCDCPNTWGFARSTKFDAATFLMTEYAHWGVSGKTVHNDPEKTGRRRITTMLLGLRLLHYLGCPRIYLLGVDFCHPPNDPYVFEEKTNPGGYRQAAAMLAEVRPVMEAAGCHVYNCNPESQCHVFDYVPYDLALNDCRGPVPRQPWDLSEWYLKTVQDAWRGEAKKRKKAGLPPMTIEDQAEIVRQKMLPRDKPDKSQAEWISEARALQKWLELPPITLDDLTIMQEAGDA